MSSLIINSISGLCPCQGEGTIILDADAGMVDWYFRARGDRWTFEVTQEVQDGPPALLFERGYPFDEVGNVMAGYMRPYQAAAIIWRCYEDFLKERKS